jgi:hypothetical protein
MGYEFDGVRLPLDWRYTGSRKKVRVGVSGTRQQRGQLVKQAKSFLSSAPCEVTLNDSYLERRACRLSDGRIRRQARPARAF